MVLTLGTTMGQPLTSSTAWLPFHVFGSNFLEQVLIGATVLADWFVNEGRWTGKPRKTMPANKFDFCINLHKILIAKNTK